MISRSCYWRQLNENSNCGSDDQTPSHITTHSCRTCDTDGCNGAETENVTLPTSNVKNEDLPSPENEFVYSPTQETIENETDHLPESVPTQDDDIVVIDDLISIIPDAPSTINDILTMKQSNSKCSRHIVSNICHGILDIKQELGVLTQLLQSIDRSLYKLTERN